MHDSSILRITTNFLEERRHLGEPTSVDLGHMVHLLRERHEFRCAMMKSRRGMAKRGLPASSFGPPVTAARVKAVVASAENLEVVDDQVCLVVPPRPEPFGEVKRAYVLRGLADYQVEETNGMGVFLAWEEAQRLVDDLRAPCDMEECP